MPYQPSALEQRIEWTRFRRQTDKDVLKALARWYCWRADGMNVQPSSLPALAGKSGIPERSVDRALRRLIDAGFLTVTARQNRHAATYRIVLERLATEDPNQMTMVVDRLNVDDESSARVARENEFERQSGARTESGAREKWPDFEKVARPYRSVEEEVPPTTTNQVLPRQSGARDAAVDTFLAWWTATYPVYNDGTPNPVDRLHDGGVILELLDHYALDRLQAMALLLWQVVADGNVHSDRSWIAASNRGVRVLRWKAVFLDLVLTLNIPEQLTFGPMEEVALTARELAEANEIRDRCYFGCPHEPRHAERRDCVRAIAVARKVG